MSALQIREARPEDLEAVVALLHEDVIREVDESEVPASSYAAAYDEICADAHQDLLVGELATAQLTWVRHLTYVGGLMCVLPSGWSCCHGPMTRHSRTTSQPSPQSQLVSSTMVPGR